MNKGFILDIPLYESVKFSWVEEIFKKTLKIPKIKTRYFSHVIELENSDEEVIYFIIYKKRNNFFNLLKVLHLVDGILENSELMRVYTNLNREIIKRPKVLKEDEEAPEMTEEEEKEL